MRHFYILLKFPLQAFHSIFFNSFIRKTIKSEHLCPGNFKIFNILSVMKELHFIGFAKAYANFCFVGYHNIIQEIEHSRNKFIKKEREILLYFSIKKNIKRILLQIK